MNQFSQKTINFLHVLLIVLIACLFILALTACQTSPELDGDVPVAIEAAPVAEVVTLPTTEPEPPVPAPLPCFPSDVRFGNGRPSMVITGFQWGETYQVEIMNISTCTFNADLNWYVYNGDVLQWSGACCGFTSEPGSMLIDVRIPFFTNTPPACDLVVLGIRVY